MEFVLEVRIIPDVEKNYSKNIRSLSKRFNYVLLLVNNPTHDDITAISIKKRLKLDMGIIMKLYLEEIMAKQSLMTEEKMAKMPVTSKLIYNPSCCPVL